MSAYNRLTLFNLPLSRKNDYSFSFYSRGSLTFRFEFVQTPFKAVSWVYKNGKANNGSPIAWDVIRVFNRRSKAYIGTIILSRSQFSQYLR